MRIVDRFIDIAKRTWNIWDGLERFVSKRILTAGIVLAALLFIFSGAYGIVSRFVFGRVSPATPAPTPVTPTIPTPIVTVDDNAPPERPASPRSSAVADRCANTADLFDIKVAMDAHVREIARQCLRNFTVSETTPFACSDVRERLAFEADYVVRGMWRGDVSTFRLCYDRKGRFDPGAVRSRLRGGSFIDNCREKSQTYVAERVGCS